MKLTIHWKYQNNGVEAEFTAEELTLHEALAVAEDLQNNNRTKSLQIFDEFESAWTVKNLKKFIKKMETEPSNVVVYFDGGFDLQSSQGGLGCAIYYEQNGKAFRVRRNRKLDYIGSNNESEYEALKFAIDILEELGVEMQTVQFIGDSQVVIHQMDGEWPVYEENLSNYADLIDEKLKKLGITPIYRLVPREKNDEADSLATQALKDIDISAKIEK